MIILIDHGPDDRIIPCRMLRPLIVLALAQGLVCAGTCDQSSKASLEEYYKVSRTLSDWDHVSRSTQCDGFEMPHKARAPVPRSPSTEPPRGGNTPLLRKLMHRDELPELAVDLNATSLAVEVGVWRGAYSATVLRKWPGKLVMIDSWLANGFDSYPEESKTLAVEAVEEFAGRFELFQAEGHEVVGDFPDGAFDFIYLDAEHTYAATRRELVDWYPKLKKGGLMSGHDYDNAMKQPLAVITPPIMFGARDAVDEFAALHNIRVYTTGEEGGAPQSWYFLKCE